MPSSPWRFLEFWKFPRIYFTFVCGGVLILGVVSIFTGAVDFVAGPFIWLACILILRLVWSSDLTWPQMLRRPVFWISLTLIIAGNVVSAMRH